MDYIEHFFILSFLIALVVSVLKRNTVKDVAVETGKLFLILAVGVLLFCVFIYVLPDPSLMTGE